MAILKHIASKNADYGEAQRYLMFQYNEDTMKPILDENGRLIPREEYYLAELLRPLPGQIVLCHILWIET